MGDQKTDDPLRRWAEELAERLATPQGLRTARRLQAAGILAEVGLQPPAAERGEAEGAAATPAGPRPISIWRPAVVDDEPAFVRPDPLPLGDHYAAVRVLRPKPPSPGAPGPRRVAFFGESAAAGYLYAPHLTPARVLEGQLREIDGPGAWEVIDLARTNERLDTLADTVEASLQLDPDLLVVFAGNNWTLLETPEISPYAPSVAARQRYAGELRRGGLEGPARRARVELVGKARHALARIAAAVGERPVVLLIPEINLADWETRQPAPWLPGGATARWHRLYRRARRRLAAGDPAAAEEAAWEMAGLDGGLGPAPFRLLARALAARGREAEARDAAISEADAVHYPLLAFLAAPQASSTARELLARGAREHGFTAVDLRPVFAAWTGSPLPGRRLFLDYCHLTVEGMKVAMAAAAAELLRLAGTPAGGWRELAGRLPEPQVSAEADATAKLGAAVHTAHRLLPLGEAAPLLEHWCREALAASPRAAEAMLDLAEMRAAGGSGGPGPAALTAAARRNFASPCRLLFQHGLSWDGLDGELLAAMAAALEAAGAETEDGPAAERLRRRLVEERGLADGGAELAVPAFYHAEPLARFFPEAMALPEVPGRATCRCPWPRTAFWLVTGAARPVTLELTARLPAVEGWEGRRGGAVEVAVDGVAVGRVDLGESWRRHRLVVPGERLRPGLHRIELAWPPPPPAGEAALEAATHRLEEGKPADLHPVFSEIFSLLVR